MKISLPSLAVLLLGQTAAAATTSADEGAAPLSSTDMANNRLGRQQKTRTEGPPHVHHYTITGGTAREETRSSATVLRKGKKKKAAAVARDGGGAPLPAHEKVSNLGHKEPREDGAARLVHHSTIPAGPGREKTGPAAVSPRNKGKKEKTVPPPHNDGDSAWWPPSNADYGGEGNSSIKKTLSGNKKKRSINNGKHAPVYDARTGNQDFGMHIVGGDSSDLGEFPYFVDLNIIGCGGSLIAPNVVLTAAHCDEWGGALIGQEVIVGAFEDDEETHGAVKVRVSGEKIHPNYNNLIAPWSDFLLLRLESSVDVGLPKLTISSDSGINSPSPGVPLTVMGVGTTSSGGWTPDFLRDVVVPVVDVNDCDDMYDGDIDPSVMFCAGDTTNGGIDSCQGDSGGPIVSRSSNTEHIQVGVVSWGVSCADKNFPGVYAKVGAVYDWIQQVVCDEWNLSADFCDGGGSSSCENNQLELDFSFTTDSWGSETSWELVDDTGSIVDSSSAFGNNQFYRFRDCAAANRCYTLTLFDSYGDGFCCGGDHATYQLDVDGVTIAQGMDHEDFGDAISFQFGNCNGGTTTDECSSNEYDFSIEFTTDGYGSETAWDLLDSDGALMANGNNFASGVTYSSQHCVPKNNNQCYTATLYDSYGDGLCCGGGDYATYEMVVDGVTIAQGTDHENFGYAASFQFGNCGASTDDCSSNEYDFSIEFTTDGYGYETSWELVNSGGTSMAYGDSFESDTTYSSHQCVPKNECYTATLYDSYGDGFCCGVNPGFSVSVDGDEIGGYGVDGALDFGNEISFSFGDCHQQSCTPVALEVHTDGWGDEVAVQFVDGWGDTVFSQDDFEDWTATAFAACIDMSECATLSVFDDWGDGIAPGGEIIVTVDGEVIYEGGDYGWGVVFQMGDACR